MANPLLRVALTGGIATGKSYCLKRFGALGAPTIDADTLAREVVAPGTPGFQEVVDRFGEVMVKLDGSLDRQRLGARVFWDPDSKRALEAIIHPRVYEAIQRWFEGEARTSHAPAAIADIPLLFETGREADFDVVVVVACPPAVQRQRLIRRNGLTSDEADQRIASQLPIEDKVRRAHFVIDTSGNFEQTDRQVAEIWNRLISGETRQQ